LYAGTSHDFITRDEPWAVTSVLFRLKAVTSHGFITKATKITKTTMPFVIFVP